MNNLYTALQCYYFMLKEYIQRLLYLLEEKLGWNSRFKLMKQFIRTKKDIMFQ